MSDLPDIGQAIAPVLLRLPRERQPLLIAVAERMAADRYRSWAADPANAAHKHELVACAEREEEIARRIEGLYPDGAALQRRIVEDNPGLDEINRSIFAGRSLPEQFTMQARGERLGAATWRAFAEHAPNADARAIFLACARLEEDSAVVLEAMLTSRSGAA
jgi:hypothetical protein